jgi:hypothetical protein
MENNNNNQNLQAAILNLFQEFQDAGGSPKVTEFKRYIDQQINQHVKPLCGHSALSSSTGGGWRNEQKARFGGRGMKWVKVSIDSILPTLDKFDASGQANTDDYRAWIEGQGFAWIRYNGPRLHNGQPAAGFEVRTTGSKFDQPKELHYILDCDLDTEIQYLHSTPHAMQLEVIKGYGVYPPIPESKPTADENIATENDEFDMDLDMDVDLD